MKTPRIVTIDEIRAARERIKGGAIRSPLVRLNLDDAPAEIYLKLENLQPVGSFKLRGAGNVILSAAESEREKGVWTASTGNMAQGVAWYARRVGADCTVVGPAVTSPLKIDAIHRLGARFKKLSWDDYFGALKTWSLPGMEGLFVHPFADPAVMAGNGTIALEILEDLPDVDAILAAYGGGGLSSGIAAAVRALKPDTKVFACEVDTGGPLGPSLAAGQMVEVPHEPSFVDAIGSPKVFPQMWPVVKDLIDDSFVMTLEAVVEAIRVMVERSHIISEGAGAIPLAAALAGKAGSGKVVCVVSGGNIAGDKLVRILQGQMP